ncbi:MAG: kelch repeat-containing protein [Chloroflexota bacterium]
MTTDRDFDALMRSWFDASAAPAQPQDLVEAVRTATARDRPRSRRLARLGGDPMPAMVRSGLSRLALTGLAAVAIVSAIALLVVLVGRPWREVGPEPHESASQEASQEATASPRAASWMLTGTMMNGGDGHAAVLLPDGRVLVPGELYDPLTGAWSNAGGSPGLGGAPTATLLGDGRALVVTDRAEIFDPRTNEWSPTGPMVAQRSGQTATLLRNGRVLVAGGMGPNSSYDFLASAEIFDPTTNTWAATGSMLEPRGGRGIGVLAGLTATLLDNGTVLVAGGEGPFYTPLASAEIYNPATGAWTATSAMSTAREFHTATLLANGLVLVVGGTQGNAAELYDPVAGSWESAGSTAFLHTNHTATLLNSGSVLVAGGSETTAAELYEPTSGRFSSAGSMSVNRSWHSATLLADGRVLIASGETLLAETEGSFRGLRSAEIYDPGS